MAWRAPVSGPRTSCRKSRSCWWVRRIAPCSILPHIRHPRATFDEDDAAVFESLGYLLKRSGVTSHKSVIECFHSSHGPDGHLGALRKFDLVDARKRARGPQLPSGDDHFASALAFAFAFALLILEAAADAFFARATRWALRHFLSSDLGRRSYLRRGLVRETTPSSLSCFQTPVSSSSTLPDRLSPRPGKELLDHLNPLKVCCQHARHDGEVKKGENECPTSLPRQTSNPSWKPTTR